MQFKRDQRQIFSIRKFKAYGAASVLLVLLTLGVNNKTLAEQIDKVQGLSESGDAAQTISSITRTSLETDNLVITQADNQAPAIPAQDPTQKTSEAPIVPSAEVTAPQVSYAQQLEVARQTAFKELETLKGALDSDSYTSYSNQVKVATDIDVFERIIKRAKNKVEEQKQALSESSRLLTRRAREASLADITTPETTPVTVNVGEEPKVEDTITTKDKLPNGTKVVFKDPVDTSTVGDKDAVVVVTYPDDSSDEVPVIVKVVESTGNFTIIIKVDGKEVQVSEFEAITHSEFLDYLSALSEAKLAEGLKQGNVSFDGNTTTLEFSTGMTSEWVEDDYVNSNKEEAENFTIIIKVDGKEVQVSELEVITHSEFLDHLSALSEAKLAEGLKQGNVSFDGNTATLEFSTGMTSEWVDETPTPTPGQGDSGKDVDGSDATTGGKVEPHILLGNKKAQAKAENAYGNNAATLPETGEKSNMGILAGTAVLLAAGAFAVRKKKQD